LLQDKPDCIINIVDASNIERNLYLSTQVIELDTPVVIALNMMDILSKRGDKIDIEQLSTQLCVPVCAISALKGEGIKELIHAAYQASLRPHQARSVLSGQLRQVLDQILPHYQGVDNAIFRSTKILECDELECKTRSELVHIVDAYKSHVDVGDFDGDFEGMVADARYRYISTHCSVALTRSTRHQGLTRSDKIDRVLTNRIWGIPIFLAIMFGVFHTTFSENFLFLGYLIPQDSWDIPVIGVDAINSPGVMLFNALEYATTWLSDSIAGAMPDGTWYTSLVVDGLLGGIFSVLSFIPQVMLLFLFLSMLEDTGYMTRVAFIMDRAFRRLGLSGKAIMPLIMCFGCAVPGIMATRVLENEQERRRTIMLAPFFSCGAKLPIWAAFAGVFASSYAGFNAELVVFGMYVLGIIIAVLAAFLLKSTLIKGQTSVFIMELPDYHMPRAKNTAIYLWQKLKHFVFKAATIIVGALIVIWFLSSFSFGLRYVEDSGDSMIGIVAKGLTYLFVPLGFGMGDEGWKFVVAVITGLIAKEMVVATLGTFAGLDGDPLDIEGADIAETSLGVMMLGIGGTLGGINVAIPAMFAFMAFNLLSVPCMAAVAAATGELTSAKVDTNQATNQVAVRTNNKSRTIWFAISFWLITAYGISALIFWVGVLFALCWWAATIVIASVICIATIVALLRTKCIMRWVRKMVG
jgi:ferrous iron transport protein B